jgi:hypothetical protein
VAEEPDRRPGDSGPPELATDDYLRLSAQKALLGEVTPPMRAVSVDLDTAAPIIRVRFIFERPPSPSEQDSARSATGVLIAQYPAPWTIDEELVVTPPGQPMTHLRLIVFHRCEDEWVSPQE